MIDDQMTATAEVTITLTGAEVTAMLVACREWRHRHAMEKAMAVAMTGSDTPLAMHDCALVAMTVVFELALKAADAISMPLLSSANAGAIDDESKHARDDRAGAIRRLMVRLRESMQKTSPGRNRMGDS